MRISDSVQTTGGIAHEVQVSTLEAEVIAAATEQLMPWISAPARRHIQFRTSRQLAQGFQYWRIGEADLARLAAVTGLPVFVGEEKS